MAPIYVGLFLIAFITLMLEIVLIRIFDVILSPGLGYMIITCAMFSFAFSGVYATLRPNPTGSPIERALAGWTFLFGLSILLIRPTMNAVPFSYSELDTAPFEQALYFTILYIGLGLPFFCSGMVFARVFSVYPEKIQPLYFYDLVGAGLGCAAWIPLLPLVGPGGLLMFAAGLALIASILFRGTRGYAAVVSCFAIAIGTVPLVSSADELDFHLHLNKRELNTDMQAGNIEVSRWDAISKIDVVMPKDHEIRRHIAYDGGSQSSYFYEFDGDFRSLRRDVESDPRLISKHFGFWGVLASHYLKRDQDQSVLIIGSAGGQEIKAALMYGAGHVDGVEMVGAVVELGTGRYGPYIGNLFDHPAVTVVKGEGRSFLRASDRKYDVIQMFSNHTTSSIAKGNGALSPVYLQTVEAYREYFEHLEDDGILHINHYVFPRMVVTAAAAWQQLGRDNFRKHVVVFERERAEDFLPTFLVKMQPWTIEEINELQQIGARSKEGSVLVENPINREGGFLSDEFYRGRIPKELDGRIPMRLTPVDDDKPFFSFFRRRLGMVEPDPQRYVDSSSAGFLNMMTKRFVPMDIIHLIVTGFASVIVVLVFIFVPLSCSSVGHTQFRSKLPLLLYFSCLGAGFIILELVLIQMFEKLIGFPLYTYSTVITTMLVAAGIGSLLSSRLTVENGNRWIIPFGGIALTSVVLFFCYPVLFQTFLAEPISIRIIVAIIAILPLGISLGMPFPMGILEAQRMPQGSITWAWAMNGVFTLVGGLGSVFLALSMGFGVTLLVAMGIYVIAFLTFWRLRLSASWKVSNEGQIARIPVQVGVTERNPRVGST